MDFAVTIDKAKELAPSAIKRADELGLDLPTIAANLIQDHNLTPKEAWTHVFRELGCSLDQAAKLAAAEDGDDNYLNKASAATSAARALNRVKRKMRVDTMFDVFHRMQGQHLIVDKTKVISDLELLKVKATHDKQYGPAVRATELQGRAAGVRFTEHVQLESDQIGDAQLIKSLAGKDRELADMLKSRLGAIDGEWVELDNDQDTGPQQQQPLPRDRSGTGIDLD